MQAPIRTNDLLNAVRFAAQHALPAAIAAGADTPAETACDTLRPLTPFSALVGEEYYAAKEHLIMDEQARANIALVACL